MRFPHLFQPGRIGRMEVRNRIIGSPMERNYCTAEGRVTQRYIDYLEVGEYGDHFAAASTKLDGLSPLVDVPALRGWIAADDGTSVRAGRPYS